MEYVRIWKERGGGEVPCDVKRNAKRRDGGLEEVLAPAVVKVQDIRGDLIH